MRARIKAGLEDVTLLFRKLGKNDRDLILGYDPQSGDSEGRPSSHEQQELFDTFVSMIALVFEFSERLGWDFEHLVRDAVDEACSNPRDRPRRAVDDVTIKVETSEITHDQQMRTYRRAVRKFNEGEMLALSDREVRVLVEIGDLDAKTIIERYREKSHEEARDKKLDERLSEMDKKFKMWDPSDEGDGK